MFGGLETMAGSPVEATIGGRKWVFRPLTLDDWGKLQAAAVEAAGNALTGLAKAWDTLPEPMRAKALEKALDMAGRPVNPDVEAIRFIQTFAGFFRLAMLVVGKAAPDVTTPEKLAGELRKLPKPEQELFTLRVFEAAGVVALQQVAGNPTPPADAAGSSRPQPTAEPEPEEGEP